MGFKSLVVLQRVGVRSTHGPGYCGSSVPSAIKLLEMQFAIWQNTLVRLMILNISTIVQSLQVKQHGKASRLGCTSMTSFNTTLKDLIRVEMFASG